jgi:hypothetical protein
MTMPLLAQFNPHTGRWHPEGEGTAGNEFAFPAVPSPLTGVRAALR